VVIACADLIITGAKIFTSGAQDRPENAIAVRGDRVVAVGIDSVRELTGPNTRFIHAGGGLVVPGFQDAHVHTPFAGLNRRRVWLNDSAGREAYLSRIKEYAESNPELPWILGGGWAMEHFPGGTPRKEDLDAVVPDRPVFLMNRDVHGAWVNSAALAIARIGPETVDPPDGRIERDPSTGDPTGTLHEGAAYTFQERHVPPPSAAEWEAAILNGQAHLHALGITGWQDAWITPGTLDAYRNLGQAGKLTARVVGALWWDRHRGLDQIPDLLEQRASGAGPGFHPTTVKIMTDGVMENYSGALLEPYCDGCGSAHKSGFDYIAADLLAAAVSELDRLGFQVHMHAIGDRAVRQSLDAVEAAIAANGHRDNRHHIAHIQLVHPDDLARFRRLDVTANIQAYWAQHDPQMDELTVPLLGEERARLQFPFGELHRRRTMFAMGSDWSVSTANPLEQIEVAVTRVDPGRRGGTPFLVDQALPLRVALGAFTAGSAFINHDEEAGHIRVGARADLAILDLDILAAGAPIGDARVTHTIAAGTVVHEVGATTEVGS
jgi:predicted amidohydrolase YtcJ